MKNLLFIFLLLPISVFSQTLELPFGVRVLNPEPLDAYYFNTSGIPYASTAEVVSEIADAVRYIGMTVNVDYVEYFFKFGTTDGDLVIKNPSPTGFWPLSGTGVLTGSTEIEGGGSQNVTIGTGSSPLSFFAVAAANVVNLTNFGGSLYMDTYTELSDNDDLRFNSPSIILTEQPPLDNSATEILARNSSTGVLEYRASSSFGSSLTSTYVGYGSVGNALTGEAAFNYNASTNTLAVDNIIAPVDLALAASTGSAALTASGNITILSGSGSIQFQSPGNTGFSVGGNLNITTNAGFYTLIGSETIIIGETGGTGVTVQGSGPSIGTGQDITIRGSNAYQPSGNGGGGDVTIRSGQRRTAGSGVDGDINLDALLGDIYITVAPDNNNSATDILARNSGTGKLEYRASSTFTSSPAGSNTQVQFNNSGAFGADADFIWNSTLNNAILSGSSGFGNTAGTLALGSTGVRINGATSGQATFTIGGIETNNASDLLIRNSTTGGRVYLDPASSSGGDIFFNLSPPTGSYFIINGIPTSAAGLPSGAIWSNAGLLTIVP